MLVLFDFLMVMRTKRVSRGFIQGPNRFWPRRRVSRERATLLRERIRHTNRIRGLLFGQGITTYNPLHRSRREC